jgi:hypothetical protein
MVQVIILVAISISVATMAVAVMLKYWRTGSQVYSLDCSESRAYMNPDTGRAVVTIVVRNTGTDTAQISHITLDGLTIKFFGGGAYLMYGDEVVSASSELGPTPQGVEIVGRVLVIKSGGVAILKFEISNASPYLTLQKQMTGTVYPYAGGRIVTFKLVVEPTGV